MTIWFLVVMSCLSPGDLTTCHNVGSPIMTFYTRNECRAVVMEALHRAALAHKDVGYSCERGVAI